MERPAPFHGKSNDGLPDGFPGGQGSDRRLPALAVEVDDFRVFARRIVVVEHPHIHRVKRGRGPRPVNTWIPHPGQKWCLATPDPKRWVARLSFPDGSRNAWDTRGKRAAPSTRRRRNGLYCTATETPLQPARAVDRRPPATCPAFPYPRPRLTERSPPLRRQTSGNHP